MRILILAATIFATLSHPRAVVAQQSCKSACNKAIQVGSEIICYCHPQCLLSQPGPCCPDFRQECPAEFEKGEDMLKNSPSGPAISISSLDIPDGCSTPESNVIAVPEKSVSFSKNNRSCTGECGTIMVDDNNESVCFCDSGCLLTGDCCPDFVDVCEVDPCILALVMPSVPAKTAPPQLSCKGMCETILYPDTSTGLRPCSCESACENSGTCCYDFQAHCPRSTSLLVKETSPNSCYSKCGGRTDNCWCDYQCLEKGDCCEDYLGMCGAEFGLIFFNGLGSCHGNCGGAGFDCWCDDKCMYSGDCCSDYLNKCDYSQYGR